MVRSVSKKAIVITAITVILVYALVLIGLTVCDSQYSRKNDGLIASEFSNNMYK